MRAVKHTWLSLSPTEEHLTPPALLPNALSQSLHKQHRTWTAVRATEPWQMDRDLSFWPSWLNHFSKQCVKSDPTSLQWLQLEGGRGLLCSQLVNNKRGSLCCLWGVMGAPGSFNNLIVFGAGWVALRLWALRLCFHTCLQCGCLKGPQRPCKTYKVISLVTVCCWNTSEDKLSLNSRLTGLWMQSSVYACC